MRTEYFLICKKTYYSNSGGTFFNLFKKALFVKGQKYKVIKDVISGISGVGGVAVVSGSTIANPSYSGITTTTTTTTTTNSYSHRWTNYTINGTPVTETFVSEYFYTLKEERHLKLMKLKKLSHDEVL